MRTRACSKCGTEVLINWSTKATRDRLRVHSVGFRGRMPGVERCRGSGELPGGAELRDGVCAPVAPQPLRLRPKMVEVPLDHVRYAVVLARMSLDRVAQPNRAHALIESFSQAIGGAR